MLRQHAVIGNAAARDFCWTCSRVFGFEQFRLVSEKMHSTSKLCIRHVRAPRIAEKLRWYAWLSVGAHVP